MLRVQLDLFQNVSNVVMCKCRRCEQIKRQDHYVEHMVE